MGRPLGSVVAYDAMHLSDHPAALITLGSPLGLQGVVYPRLRPQPPTSRHSDAVGELRRRR
ncbi:hypothetical protein [Nocardia sp. NPDC058497]|uniref:hypothetical protein n=1 Tax=Nocardia sp. NPDC058497 TaxID=3346529 RepID=UPI00366869B9